MFTNKRKLFITCFFTFSFSYFVYHFINLDNGISTLFKKNKIFILKQKEVDTIKDEINMLSKKIESLDKEPHDIDLINELARRTLGYSEDNEITIKLEK